MKQFKYNKFLILLIVIGLLASAIVVAAYLYDLARMTT